MTWRTPTRRQRITGAGVGLLAAVHLVFVGGCQQQRPANRAATSREEPRSSDPVQAEAAELGRHIFDLADDVDSYQSSHRGRLPRSLRQLGQDSIVGPVVRRISTTGGGTITAAFRRPQEHTLHWCSGNLRVLEDAALRGDAFEVTCSGVDGPRTITVRLDP